ncbi:MAG: penicillin-binding protein activator [Rhodobacterales bacterium]|nr:MAG: penicillin-binding protein activator [Rhodobacterales bacterium]
MIARFDQIRKFAARLTALLAMTWLAACDVPTIGGGGGGPAIDPTKPVQVALLVPGGSGQATDSLLARDLENAARLASKDLQGASIDLRIYNTAGNPQQAATVTRQAIADGAKIILGPLYSEAAVASGVAAANDQVNVLSFSNTPTIAGGNVFVMGSLFQSSADRLVRYARAQGVQRYYIARANDLQGELGAAAAAQAVTAAGGQVVGTHAYPLSQQDVILASSTIADQARAAGAQAIILTANVGPELAILGTKLPEAGIDTAATRLIGLTRWNSVPEMLDVPGLQGGYFALPDTGRKAAFDQRFKAAYGQDPHPLAGLAYDGVAAIGALAATGDRNALSRSFLTRSSGFQGTNGIFRFMPNGLNQRGLAVATIENGRTRVLSPAPSAFSNALY